MGTHFLSLAGSTREPRTPAAHTRKLGEILVELGHLTPLQLRRALLAQRRMDTRLGDMLVHEGFIDRSALLHALSIQHGLPRVDKAAGLDADPWIPADLAVRLGIVPWRDVWQTRIVAADKPENVDTLRAMMEPGGAQITTVLAHAQDIRAAQARLYGAELARRAERRVDPALSCRDWGKGGYRRWVWLILTLAALLCTALLAPGAVLTGIMGLAVFTLTASVGLKLAAATAQLRAELRPTRAPPPAVSPMRRPHVSVMVPLLREKEIAGALIRRLSRLRYPRALLDVILVLEEDDAVTRQTLARTELPAWIRVVEVPAAPSGLTTKPRALNYALDFCKGSLIGIWDAEDAPDPDQLETVVSRFHTAPPDVACMQGQLDYYNPRANWIARCFTIEYATWWRLIMPGLARLGFVIPLGGTTLFFRRDVLENLGGWDAHNVTEDADLGVRLARAGWRTELIPTVTHEEANCRAWPWIRQRSRWLKGFAITWAVHMRRPGQLWRDLGTRRFWGLQLFFLTALSQFFLAPIYWSFWLIAAGAVGSFLPTSWLTPVAVLFVIAELSTLTLHILAVRRAEHRHLIPWTLTMPFYFPLATVAIYKAAFELVQSPFYWDKTEHGVTGEDGPESQKARTTKGPKSR